MGINVVIAYRCYIVGFFLILIQLSYASSDRDWRVGFEFEMPYIGIMNDSPEDEAFPKEIILEGRNWILMRDTLDSKVEKAYFSEPKLAPGVWNLEFKTKSGGLFLGDIPSQEETITEILKVIDYVLNPAKSGAGTEVAIDSGNPSKPHTFVVKTVRLDELAAHLHLQVGSKMRGKEIKIALKEPTKIKTIRPQITLQLPLSKVPAVFHHLYMLGADHRISWFFHPRVPNSLQALQCEKIVSHRSVDGLMMLFDFYVERFFMRHDEREPGPKPSFPIMSRLQFRSMYESLPGHEKVKFYTYVQTAYSHFVPRLRAIFSQEDRFVSRYMSVVEKAQQELVKNVEAASLPALPSVEYLTTCPQSQMTELQAQDLGFLRQRQAKRFDEPLSCEYSLNETREGETVLAKHQLMLSIEQILNSITDPRFNRTVIDDEGQSIRKTSDYFSTPFERLEADYSMGALAYPIGTSQPVAILELRSYPTILENLEVDNIREFFRIEASYMRGLMQLKTHAEVRPIDLENLQNLLVLQRKAGSAVKILDEKYQKLYPGTG